MKQKLRIRLINKPHAYPEVPEAYIEAWGQVVIQIFEDQDLNILFQTEWDLALLAEWFTENREAICRETLKVGEESAIPSESLSQALSRLQSREFIGSNEERESRWFDALDGYRSRHNLWYGLMGSKIPDIIIGCHNSMGEISSFERGNEWCFRFDMAQFIDDFQREIHQFINTWLDSTSDSSVHDRAEKILSKINTSLSECCGENPTFAEET